MNKRRTVVSAVVGALGLGLVTVFGIPAAQAAREDCGDLPNPPAKPVQEAQNEENPNIQNDYDEVVEEDTRPGVVYLAVIGGDTPKPNKCGLNPSNPPAEWTGWGGPLDGDNVTIGEGAGTRNEIVIGGVYFKRGIGTHAPARLVYDLTGGDYRKFEAYVGMSDEKDPAECGHGGSSEFIFNVDGKEMFASGVLMGTEGGMNVDPVKVEFEIPAGARELEIVITDGGDGNGCDHSTIGDAKLLTAAALSVDPAGKLTTTWGTLKAR
ncbi:MAG: hypothetical protein KatS3mg115_2551 [Candidatus Poribacteria bacterium]|nr:MAG: hypothetical protein KatS3mg115_2551 [Candidatus Poribacteria bacterium]